MKKEFKEGDWVTNPEWGESKPFKLESGHYKGISQRSNIWFNGLQEWIPKQGEWCWFKNDSETRTFIGRFNNQHGELYSCKEIPFLCQICEPFLGQLPSFI